MVERGVESDKGWQWKTLAFTFWAAYSYSPNTHAVKLGRGFLDAKHDAEQLKNMGHF